MKSILVLGAGHVSRPLVEYLTRNKNFDVLAVSWCENECNILESFKRKNLNTMVLNVKENDTIIDYLIMNTNIVVNFLPFTFHEIIAEKCINLRKNLITTNYLVPELIAMNQRAINAGVTIVVEIGLQPGIDHMLAMQCFDEVRAKNGKILGFSSYCGGLPEPQFSINPIKYKFSWSPIRTLLNTKNPAKWLQNGEIKEIQCGGELMNYGYKIDYLKHLNLEAHYNRDATKYIKTYNLNDAHTVIRGTLRYEGFCKIMNGFITIGLLDEEPHPCLAKGSGPLSWKEFLCELLNQDRDCTIEELKCAIFDRVELSLNILSAIEEIGFLSNNLVNKKITPLETVSEFLKEKLSFKWGETDIVILHDEIDIEWENNVQEKRIIDLIVRGDSGGDSAMAKTVGLTAAIATKLVLEEKITDKGMVLPMTEDFYGPILEALSDEGINAHIYNANDDIYKNNHYNNY